MGNRLRIGLDSKSPDSRGRVGSIPTSGTNKNNMIRSSMSRFFWTNFFLYFPIEVLSLLINL
jgi:hypothetical protein